MTSKYELIQWVNTFNSMDGSFPKINRVENLQTGIFFCKIFNHLFPNSIQIALLRESGLYNDFYLNLKLLQNGF
jgi:hypothetical protein